jgi:hypothetical protein
MTTKPFFDVPIGEEGLLCDWNGYSLIIKHAAPYEHIGVTLSPAAQIALVRVFESITEGKQP